MSRMGVATSIGLAICERFSKATLDFIAEWDPDLHFLVMDARKKKGIHDQGVRTR